MDIRKHIEHIQTVGVRPDEYIDTYIDEIKERFRELNLDKYGFIIENEDDFSRVFSYKIDDIEGLRELSENDRAFVLSKGVYKLVNGVSLETKPYWTTYKVEKHPDKYKLYTGMGYSWLHPSGRID